MNLAYRTRRIDEDWHRLIPSRFPPVEVYERLGPSALGDVAKTLEVKTNPRLQSKTWLLGKTAELSEASVRLQNWNHAPFAYRNPEGSTFLNPSYGVLEVIDGVEPALGHAVRRRETFLGRTREPATYLDMRLLVTRASGDFIDLTEAPFDPDQVNRWKLGEALYRAEAKGVVFRRAETPHALALAVFDNRVLGRSKQTVHYRFVWDGEVIRKIYDFSTGEEISREKLMAACEGRAAA